MKKIALFTYAVLFALGSHAQITEDFETNNFGWTERVSDKFVAVIKDGKMHLEGKFEAAFSDCYAPFDISKPFELKCESFVKSLSGKKNFGIIVDYEDDYNYTMFTIEDDQVKVTRVERGQIVGHRIADLKLKSTKKTGVDFKLEYTLQKLTLYVNDMKAIDYQRRLPTGQFLLGTSGIGFYAGKNTTVDFDNLVITQ